jgi:hypothetical protein
MPFEHLDIPDKMLFIGGPGFVRLKAEIIRKRHTITVSDRDQSQQEYNNIKPF